MWVEKYKPKSLQEFAGNASAIGTIRKWLDSWNHSKKKALLIAGQQGVGKTTAVELIAKEKGLLLVHTDASDVRSEKELKEKFSENLKQNSLFHKGKIILFDEIDAISGINDRGAAKEIIELIKTSPFPIIVIANNLYERKLATLKNHCDIVQFTKVYTVTIEKKLKELCKNESIGYEDSAIKTIAITSSGDLKAAINDLESSVLEKQLKNIHENYRDSEKNVFEVLKIIFKTTTAENAAKAMSISDKELNELIQWIRENVPYEYMKPKENAEAYNFISRADLFMGRIVRQQYWRYAAYASDLASIGTAVSKNEKYAKFFVYKYPSRIAKLGRTKADRADEKELAEKLGKRLHCSRRISKTYFPLLKIIQKKQPHKWAEIYNELGLENE